MVRNGRGCARGRGSKTGEGEPAQAEKPASKSPPVRKPDPKKKPEGQARVTLKPAACGTAPIAKAPPGTLSRPAALGGAASSSSASAAGGGGKSHPPGPPHGSVRMVGGAPSGQSGESRGGQGDESSGARPKRVEYDAVEDQALDDRRLRKCRKCGKADHWRKMKSERIDPPPEEMEEFNKVRGTWYEADWLKTHQDVFFFLFPLCEGLFSLFFVFVLLLFFPFCFVLTIEEPKPEFKHICAPCYATEQDIDCVDAVKEISAAKAKRQMERVETFKKAMSSKETIVQMYEANLADDDAERQVAAQRVADALNGPNTLAGQGSDAPPLALFGAKGEWTDEMERWNNMSRRKDFLFSPRFFPGFCFACCMHCSHFCLPCHFVPLLSLCFLFLSGWRQDEAQEGAAQARQPFGRLAGGLSTNDHAPYLREVERHVDLAEPG